MKNLVFVESPTKANTLAKFLGKNYQVEPTFGHVRDLPRGTFGVDVFKNFEPKYVIPKKLQKRVNQLIKISKDASKFYLASLFPSPFLKLPFLFQAYWDEQNL